MSSAQGKGPDTIEAEADLGRHLAALVGQCPDMARLHGELGCPPLRRRPAGFEGLVHIVVFQQISLAAARAIWERTLGVFGSITPAILAAASDEDFRAAGQSRPKIRTLRAIAAAVLDGSLDFDAIGRLEADAAHAALVQVKGIGPWTADVYLLSCLGHPDAWPAGDVALQAAAGDLLGLAARPDAKAMAALGERWRPYRAVAARLLWAHYARLRGRAAEPATTA
ncbi:MAG: DNA-3-methyladenine glycosylase 2 family protein [Phreatobacter sp.]|uniref:DNA-3-methyladenine glycosylase family protein n=1 Tax=Phreatobacter sp. TaxID=1966341 RepID=UPI001A47FC34|nr:DNA-3-methyladenine glycosylase 2 family protein [Phreatobacter sp.]MBL8570859.1 DNA-3-methyladenine glycosylase 2 family protein [Phreatobacter sp.]